MRAFRVPLRIPFRGVTVRDGVLLRGPSGWGECSPFADYPPQRAARWLAAAEEAASGTWPPPVRHTIPVNVTIPAVAPDVAHAMVRASSCTTAKVKVAERRGPGGADRPFGALLAEDLARVEAVRDALGPGGAIRVDANAGWDTDEAATAIAALDRFGLEYVEQPVASLTDMARLRRRVEVPLAADESIRTAEDPLHVAGLAAADLVVLKVAPLGGVASAMAVAEACGLPVVVSSALETSIGLAAGLAFAAALPELPYACGLATADLLGADVVAEPHRVVDGAIALRRPDVDEDALARVELHGAQAREVLGRVAAARAAGARR
jgi:O-succinylbenzoate synthase